MATGTEQLVSSSNAFHASSVIFGIPYSSSAQIAQTTQAFIPDKAGELDEKKFTAIVTFAVFSSLLVVAFILSRVKEALTRPRGANRKQKQRSTMDFVSKTFLHHSRSQEKKHNLHGFKETVNPQIDSGVRVKPSPGSISFAAVNKGFDVELYEGTTSANNDGYSEESVESMDRAARFDKNITQRQVVDEDIDTEQPCYYVEREDILLVGPVIYV